MLAAWDLAESPLACMLHDTMHACSMTEEGTMLPTNGPMSTLIFIDIFTRCDGVLKWLYMHGGFHMCGMVSHMSSW